LLADGGGPDGANLVMDGGSAQGRLSTGRSPLEEAMQVHLWDLQLFV